MVVIIRRKLELFYQSQFSYNHFKNRFPLYYYHFKESSSRMRQPNTPLSELPYKTQAVLTFENWSAHLTTAWPIFKFHDRAVSAENPHQHVDSYAIFKFAFSLPKFLKLTSTQPSIPHYVPTYIPLSLAFCEYYTCMYVSVYSETFPFWFSNERKIMTSYAVVEQ